jgi:uncharacterized protein YdhG (YjbR/CyaY superfamily)
MKSLKQLIEEKNPVDKNKYVTREYQDYGYRLAKELNDEKYKSLYIKLAKTVDRGLLEQVRRFVIDSNADRKGALFMWKLKELRNKK